MSTQQEQLTYIEKNLVFEISKYFGKEAKLVSHRVECSNGLDGFMSALYNVELELEISGEPRKETVLVKFMKGNKAFRSSSKSYTQFANEVFVYAEIIPAFEHLLRSSKLSTNLAVDMVPRCYRAEFGRIEGLGEDLESVLALKHLTTDGFSLGPRIVLRHDQLEAMCAVVGTYHALGYALRVVQPQVHERLRAGVIPLPFVADATQTTNIYHVLYSAAMERFYKFYDRKRQDLLKVDELEQDRRFAGALELLREKYFAHPVKLLERIRTGSYDTAQTDSYFSTFLHGDFNRNNVLFHYSNSHGVGDGTVNGIKVIDFQELRYSTPAIDLSFFMYMNTPPEDRDILFASLLRKYHKHMHEVLELVLQRNRNTLSEADLQGILDNYSFERFEAHFNRYAFYGAMVCMHFKPWLLGTESDCEALSKLFESDMHGTAFWQLSLDIAGDKANHEIFKIMRHAFKQGYMDAI
ncbi:uncharacterized protein LOC115629864 [Scaptodrosophila lebanonensis]|uniref:Uncharacterized protein LOC115629864 n=1 Tax=Drosophila lebanonensis TaxID=7225 RepID=A0A6J2U590_DROLE|nr:uncharacterized protein LOC115629864 [Scaptodrosophila lebanonensis]